MWQRYRWSINKKSPGAGPKKVVQVSKGFNGQQISGQVLGSFGSGYPFRDELSIQVS